MTRAKKKTVKPETIESEVKATTTKTPDTNPPTDNDSTDNVFIESETVNDTGAIIQNSSDTTDSKDDSVEDEKSEDKEDEDKEDEVVVEDEKSEDKESEDKEDEVVVEDELNPLAKELYAFCTGINPPGYPYDGKNQVDMFVQLTSTVLTFINTRNVEALNDFVKLVGDGNAAGKNSLSPVYHSRRFDIPADKAEYFNESVTFVIKYISKAIEEDISASSALYLFNGKLPKTISTKSAKLIKDRKF